MPWISTKSFWHKESLKSSHYELNSVAKTYKISLLSISLMQAPDNLFLIGEIRVF